MNTSSNAANERGEVTESGGMVSLQEQSVFKVL